MKRLILLLTVVLGITLMNSCNKEYDFPSNPNNPNNPSVVTLKHGFKSDLGEEFQGKSTIVSNQTIYTDSVTYNGTWIEQLDAVGTFTIRNSSGIIVFQDSLVNEIEFKFPLCDVYTLNVNGIYQGSSFEYTNIQFIVSSIIIPPPPPIVYPTFPIFFRNFHISNGNAIVDIYLEKAGFTYNINNSVPWLFVSRTNGQNFINDQTVVDMGDSVKITISTPAINNNYFEFNFKNNETWCPVGNNILNSGTPNIPYQESQSWFGFKLVLNSNIWEMRTYNGTLILTNPTSGIPGNVGDGPENNYRVRRTHRTIYFKTNVQNPIVAYQTGNGTTVYMAPTHSLSENLWEFTIPESDHQINFFGWFEMIGGNYSSVNTISEMRQSKYRIEHRDLSGQALILGVNM